MSKRTTFTTITPLPPDISRQTVLNFLHDHKQIIDLNPLIKERHPIRPPSHAAPDELRCAWYSLTDHVSYLPGRVATGEVTYTCAFNNLPNGVQTHCYAPAGLDIRERWTVNGSLPGEPKQPVELGLRDAPMTGLYIREDVDMTCNIIMASFVRKTLKDSHAELVERLKLRAQLSSQRAIRANNSSMTSGNTTIRHNTPYNNSNLRNIHGLDRASDNGNKNLTVYNWLNAQPRGEQPQPHHQNRSGSNRSTESNGSSNNNSNMISPVSHASPSYRKTVVSPPTPPYTPMVSPLWTQLRPPSQPQTLASLSPVPPAPVSPNRPPPPPRPPRPDEQNQQKKQKPTIRLVPEPLRIPRTAVPVAVVQSYSPNQVIKSPPPNTTPLVLERNKKSPTTISHRKFSYDSTSSTENYLVPLPLTSSSPVEVFKRLPPPQHILSQSRDYHQQALTINSPVQLKPSLPSSPVLGKLQRHMGKQFISFNPFEEHPDYPHMSPYMDDIFGEGGEKADDDEYEDVKVDNDGDLEIDSYYHFNERDRDILSRKTLQVQVQKKQIKEQEEKEEDIIMNDNDSGYADYVVTPPPPPPTSKPPLPPMGIRVVQAEVEENQMIGATLSGPFVAAFDEFNICLP